ncbi:MAG: monovalent cation/H(+) antiporter subunit G [Pseudolabrys sp.]|jgi:multicomponent Na+:H+ antiporter subunit G
MKITVDIMTVVLVSAGAFFFMAGTVGLLRFPDTLTRLHALTKVDNLGLGLIVVGLLPQVEGLLGVFKLISIWVLVQLSGAIVSQLIAQATQRSGRQT